MDTLHPTNSWTLNASVLHWEFFWNAAFQGEVYMTSPSGREIMRLKGDGFSLSGHISNGARPYDTGPWNLTLDGVGEFHLLLRLHWLPREGWDKYGLPGRE